MSEVQVLKELLEKQGKTFDEFKTANDEREAEVKKLGTSTTETATKVEKVNKALDEIGDQIKAVSDKMAKEAERVDGIETALQRTPQATPEQEAKARKSAAKLLRKHVDEVTDVDIKAASAFDKAFGRYIRKAMDPGGSNLGPEIQKDLSAGSDPDGGFWVPTAMLDRVVMRVYETGPMRQVAGAITISTDGVSFPIDNEEADAGWVAETQARPNTGTPGTGEQEIRVHEMYANPRATQKLLDDAAVNVEQWLADKVADRFTRTENEAFITGSGTGQPKGMLNRSITDQPDDERKWGTLQYVPSGAANGFAATDPVDQFIDLVQALKAAHRANARWMMNRATVGEVRKFKDGQGNYIWQPGAQAGQPSMLLGYPVAEGEDMPGVAADAYPIAFGDFREGYLIVDRQGIRTLRDPYTAKPYVQFYSTRRVGGDVTNSEAIKVMKIATS